MCGIAGFILNQKARDGRFPVDDLAARLLTGIEARGVDATGFLGISPGDNGHPKLNYQRLDEKASAFVTTHTLDPLTTTALLHTRKWTKGMASVVVNNHPVVWDSCFVVHNGHISNDDAIIEEAGIKDKRIGTVDSFAIPVALKFHGMSTNEDIQSGLGSLEGPFAIACAEPFIHPDKVLLAKGEGSPLVILNARQGLFWASERKAIIDAWGEVIGTPPNADAKTPGALGFTYLKEGEYWVVDAGRKNKGLLITAGKFNVKKKPAAHFGSGWGRNDYQYHKHDVEWTCWPNTKDCIFGDDCGDCASGGCQCYAAQGHVHPRLNEGVNFQEALRKWMGFKSLVEKNKLTEDELSTLPTKGKASETRVPPGKRTHPLITITPTHVTAGGRGKTSARSGKLSVVGSEDSMTDDTLTTECFFCHRQRDVAIMVTISEGDSPVFKCPTCVSAARSDAAVVIPGHDASLDPSITEYTNIAGVANAMVEAAITQTALELKVQPELVRYCCLYQRNIKDENGFSDFQKSMRALFKDNIDFMAELRALEATK